jgi:hypothetical protein
MPEKPTHEELTEAAVVRLQRLMPFMAPQVRSSLADAVATSVERRESP